MSETQVIAQKAKRIAARKVWLPTFLYNILPYFYLLSGIAALAATLFVSEWFWVLPYWVLFSAACLQFGVSVIRRRNKRRRRQHQRS